MPFVRRGPTRIHYEVSGEGPAVLFHTGAGGDLRIWEMAGYLSGLPEFRAIRIDQRGRGRSDHPTSAGAHRMDEYVEDVAAVLDDAGVRTAGFWGYSNGILVGIAFGGAHPDRLTALVGTGGIRLRDLTDLPRVDPAREIEEDVARGGVRFELDSRMAAEGDRFPEAIDRNVREGDPRMHALCGVAWLDWHGPRSVLAGFRAPTLFLTGEKEDPGHETEKTAAFVPGARVERVPGVGHLGAFYRSDLTLDVARRFLRDHLG